MSAAPSCNGTNRDLNKTIEAEQRWQLAMEAHMGFGSEGPSIYGSSDHHFDQDYVEQHPVNVFTHLNNPTDFIDAWSVDNLNGSNNGNAKSSLSMNHGNLSPSLKLSIAMVAGNVLNEEIGKVQLGGDGKYCAEHGTKDSRWLSPVSWGPFAPGGPLAEALQPGPVAFACTHPPSPHDSIGIPASTVSSPCAVLQRTFFSHSDNVCNSPASAAHPWEVAFQRLN